MKSKKIIAAGLALTLLASPFMNPSIDVSAKEQPKVSQSTNVKLTDTLVVKLASQWQSKASYIQRGGDYKDGEYKTFQYKGKTYRYLSSSIDTKKELYNYVRSTLTSKQTLLWFKNSGIIEYKGKLAQLEADGGSILDWKKATAEYVKTDKKTKIYRVFVPVGETGEKAMYLVDLEREGAKWKISKIPYLDLDIPFNINPAFQFLNHVLKNHEVAQEQFIGNENFAVNFKKGVNKIEVKQVKEVARTAAQVEYVVKFDVGLEKNYQGSLKEGMNQLYFLIQQTDEMEFKIVSVGTAPHIEK